MVTYPLKATGEPDWSK